MKISNDRLNHSLAVARKMKEIVELNKNKYSVTAEEAFLLGFVHDIGYEFCEVQEEHSSAGGVVLKAQGFKLWKEVFYHGINQEEYESIELQLLNYVDMTTSPQGQYVTVENRLLDIGQRYGFSSEQYIEADKMSKKILGFNFDL